MKRPLEQLDDYVSGAMEDADAYEAALFDAAAAGEADDAAFVERLRRSIADLVKRGSYEITLTKPEVEKLQRESELEVVVVHVVRDANLNADEVLATAELVVWEMPVALGGVDRVDLELGIEGQTFLTLPDVKVDRENDRVFLCCEGELVKASFRPGSRTRIVGHAGGERRQLAEFVYQPARL